MSPGEKLTFVTSNRHKAREIKALFRSQNVKLNIHFAKTMEIQSENLAEIALFSSIDAYNYLRRPVFVEDAGLFVEELNGFPGPYSSYVYSTLGLDGLLRLVGKNRKAVFKSVVCVYGLVDRPLLFTGNVSGVIAPKPRGKHGFGYDPIFIPSGSGKTLAEMSVAEKNRFSHRGRAVRKLLRWLYKDRRKI
ncbi:MAG: XTP/dITP diphosphatase [Candidatus Caldarchaeum sp.]|nr:XTP/dITP diphosphatase [Candidatus Caldarchaeum sp.]MCS7133431.1 XTP/dITP diphosphatase [Candidatus Caldarchaeum sp.]MCX8201759.1 XTP/dITP diphosphatase [Candidatus Caldarchaeum sp.]MDW8062786.1 XTP/dITP diphosphatase [Candidatus Caldarchaeum sp.]MDW8435040.1 XTP/dITP diphosphatase [Candidatus Caldarchaeum sp.]